MQRIQLASFGSIIALLAVVNLPSEAGAQTMPSGPTNQPHNEWMTPNQSSWNSSYNPVYDLGPAMARAAYTSAAVDRAYANWSAALMRARLVFETSPDYHAAQQELSDARDAYESAKQAVLNKVAQEQSYRDQIDKRDAMDAAMHTPGIDRAQYLDLADKKMHAGTSASLMEQQALASDSHYQQARTRLIHARQDVDLKVAQFQATVGDQPAVAKAAEALDVARVNDAAASAYLSGEWIVRNDSMDADYRRFPPSLFNIGYSNYPSYSNYPYFSPYFSGFYGLGTSVVSITR